MKYLIVTLIKGEAGQYQQKLLYSTAKKFNVKGAIQRKPPAHITLKYSFETADIKPIAKCIEEFCKSNKRCQYKLKKLDHFADETIFIDVIPSNEMKKTYSKFITVLKKNTDLKFKKFDGKTHFHSSIAHTDIKDKFNEIWPIISKEKPDFDCSLDNIAILKLVKGVWRTYKEFTIKL